MNCPFSSNRTILTVSKTLNLFSELSANRILKEQIRHLVVTFAYDSISSVSEDAFAIGIQQIFDIFTSVTHLEFVSEHYFPPTGISLNGLAPDAFSSSTITYLSVRVFELDDCIRLLDGRLSCLHTLVVQVHEITSSANGLDDTVRYMLMYRLTTSFQNCCSETTTRSTGCSIVRRV